MNLQKHHFTMYVYNKKMIEAHKEKKIQKV